MPILGLLLENHAPERPFGQGILQLLLSTYSSVRLGRVQLKNLLPRPALREPRQQEELLSISRSKTTALTMPSGFIFLA